MRSLTLQTSDGHALAADIADAAGLARGAVVLCHPHPLFGGNRFNNVVDDLFTALPAAGFTTIRFDFRAAHDRGIGERLDVIAAIDAVYAAGVPLFVVGYSFGGMVTLSTRDERIAAVVGVAAPLTSEIPAPVVPTLLLVPRSDQYCPPDKVTTAIAGWAGVDVEVIESADHFLAGRTAEIAQRATAWLTGRVSSPS